MKKLLIVTLAFSLTGLAAIPAAAADSHEAHHAMAVVQKSYVAKGEVVSVDKAADKVKLKHEAITELGWPAMTMDFAVADKKLLDGVKAGDKVNFEIIKDQTSGQYVIRALQAVK